MICQTPWTCNTDCCLCTRIYAIGSTRKNRWCRSRLHSTQLTRKYE